MNISSTYIVAALLFLVLPTHDAFAHAGHAEAPGSHDDAPSQNVTLTDAAIHNLGIQTEKAVIADIATTMKLNALVDALPDRYAQITSKVPSRVVDVAVQSGEKVKAGARLATLQPLIVGSTTIILSSPIDGVILKQNALSGQTTQPENPLFEIADLKDVLVRGQAYETGGLGQLKIGQVVSITTNSYPDKIFAGKIERINAELDRATRTLDVYARVVNTDELLLKNMQVAMHVETSDKAQGVVVPRRAILGDAGNRFLFVKEGNGFERRDIKLGIIYGDKQEILEGVFPDEDIVITGQYQLQFAPPSKQQPAKEHKD
ncbi:MAG: efflux RND transporter periplasmic adaptor subunit [Alphaproteobacteria bacterium]|nr:efflux RND transporter periplasmic adaptor subunit [Alphaproteobacteria bacterium]